MKNLPFLMMFLFANVLFSQTKIAESNFDENKNRSNFFLILNSENQNVAIKNKVLKIRFNETQNEVIFKVKVNHFEKLELVLDFSEKPNSFQTFVSSNKKSWKELETDKRYINSENYTYFYSFENNKKWIYLKLQSKESSELIVKSIKFYGDHDKEIIIPLPD